MIFYLLKDILIPSKWFFLHYGQVLPFMKSYFLVILTEEWSLNELSTQMNINKTSVRSRISFWIGQGVILEKQNDTFATAQSFQNQLHGIIHCSSSPT